MAHIIYDPRKPITEHYDIEEYCAHCDDYIPVTIDENCLDCLETTCPVCGHTLMLCSSCSDLICCDWTEGIGCRKRKGGSLRHE